MLENAIERCPPGVWGDAMHPQEFWYIAYHTLFWTDFYFSDCPEADFQPPAPFTKSEFEVGTPPRRAYGKAELLAYLAHVWDRSRQFISELAPPRRHDRFAGEHHDVSVLEITLYNTRHVQHHAAQLNLILRQRTDDAPKWHSRTARPLI